jgi:hypothetical protein
MIFHDSAPLNIHLVKLDEEQRKDEKISMKDVFTSTTA